jgi:hypothetical protein
MLGHVVEHHRDHVCLLYDLPNGTALAQKIVVSSIFLITKIIIIKDHKLHNIFLHIVFRSQSMLKPTSNQTGSYTNWRTGEGDQKRCEWEPIKILRENLAYISKSTRRASLLTRAGPRSYRQAIILQNHIRETETQRKQNKMQVKLWAKPTTAKIESTGFSLPHPHFIKHFIGMTEKLSQEHNEH